VGEGRAARDRQDCREQEKLLPALLARELQATWRTDSSSRLSEGGGPLLPAPLGSEGRGAGSKAHPRPLPGQPVTNCSALAFRFGGTCLAAWTEPGWGRGDLIAHAASSRPSSPAPGPSTPSRGQQVRRPSPGRDAHRGRHGAEQLPSLSPSCRSLPQTRLGSCTEALQGLSLWSACTRGAGRPLETAGYSSVLAKAPLSFSRDFARHWRRRLHSGSDSCVLHGSPPLVWEEEVTREGNVRGPGA